jgi:membrane dipeptidase
MKRAFPAITIAALLWFSSQSVIPAGPVDQPGSQPHPKRVVMPTVVGHLLPPPKDYNFVHPASVPCGDPSADLSYKVPLSPEQEKRATRLHHDSFVILAHVHCVEPWDFEAMRRGGITAIILKVDDDGLNLVNGQPRTFVAPDEDWVARATREMRRVREMAAQPKNKIAIVRTLADLRRAKQEGKVGVIFSFEGARPLAGKLENLKYYEDLGMRELQLWWAVPNQLKTPDQHLLSQFGLDVIREMNRLGIVIDLSHMDGDAFVQVMNSTHSPVIISHCAVGELYRPPNEQHQGENASTGTDRLNDYTIRAMARNGGTICLHFVYPSYILPRHGTPKATVIDFVDHIEYIRNLVGIDYVSVGTDFFPEAGWEWIEGAGQLSLVPNVTREMVKRGFTDEEIRKVLGGNLMRVFKANWEHGEAAARS